ncbi:MAG: efflux RND transporter permease subunit [Verrucomicrobia bacterium]|nr:efflux RND transporter permease subunit [Verrucomicrobiota bacterium]MDA1067837.1 efflux RND transporter permease subunit [Verrucomicrobiota bacterium]
MHSIIAWFARNGVAANLLMVALIAGGIYGASQIVLEEYPDRPFRRIDVSVTYRGSTPGEVEQAIVTRLEEALFDIEGIEEFQGRANASKGTVSLEIEDGYNLSEKLDEVTNRVSAIRTFPPEAEKPQINLYSVLQRVITIVLSGDLTEKESKILGEQLRDEVSNLPDVSIVTLKAVRPYEIAIEVSESTLRQYGLTFDQIARAIRTSSVDLSAGSVKTETGRILLRTNQQAYHQEDFASIVVLTRSDGTQIRLSDVADVKDGFSEIPIVSKYNGKRAIAIDVYRSGSQSAIEIGESVKAFIESKQAQFPEGIFVDYWDDDSERIKVRLTTLKDSAILGFVLVVIILSLFLRPILAFWVALGIPIAFGGTFFLLPYMGITLNIGTLIAFILTLGIVVDDAIVTGENVFQHMQRGGKPLSAAINGTNEVSIPVFFGVITTMVAFLPLFLLTGTRGAIYGSVPVVVIPVLFFSLVESKLILPAHLSHTKSLRITKEKLGPFSRFQRSISGGLERFISKYYRPFLNYVLVHRYVTFSVFFGLLLIFVSLVLGDRISYRSSVSAPSDTTTITLLMPAGTNFEVTQEKVNMIEGIALKFKADLNRKFGTTVIKNVFATAGGMPFQNAGYQTKGPSAGVAELGEILIELTPSELSEVNYSSKDLVNELRDLVPPIPEAEQFNFSFMKDESQVLSFNLAFHDVEKLKEASIDLQQKLNSFAGLYDIEDSYERSNEQFNLDLRPEAEYLGVTAVNLAQQVRTAFYGTEAQRIQRGRDEIQVMVRYPEKDRNSLASLNKMMIRTANGTEVPFETVATISTDRSLPSIKRMDRKRVVTVNANGDPEKLDVMSMENEILLEYLPQLVATKYPGMTFETTGKAAKIHKDNARMVRGIFIVIALIYAILAIPLKSYVKPLIVMSAIPFGVVGGIAGHWIMASIFGFNNGNPVLTQTSIMGMMALCGVVVNDSLVLVDFMNQQLKKGIPIGEVVRRAGERRFRPILLTSLTTFFGLMPLMFEDSPQAVWMIPMAISLGWGIVFATTITLLLVPVLILIFNDFHQFMCKLYEIDPGAHKEEEELASTGSITS